jgi:hypothetical protein
MSTIDDLFPEECSGYEYFGFAKGAKLHRDIEHVKVIGLLKDFKLPDKRIEIVITGTNKLADAVEYLPKDILLVYAKPLPIKTKEDKAIRSVISKPITYCDEEVFTEPEQYKDGRRNFDPVTYVGKKYVAVCAPLIILG